MDAGLCYDRCQSGTKGVGPVCWGQCGGARPFDCGAFCARDSGSCADLGVRIGQTGGKLRYDVTLQLEYLTTKWHCGALSGAYSDHMQ